MCVPFGAHLTPMKVAYVNPFAVHERQAIVLSSEGYCLFAEGDQYFQMASSHPFIM